MKSFTTFLIIFCLAILSLFVGINACNEQNINPPNDNTISGTILDEQDLGVPNATVEIVNYPSVIKEEKEIQSEKIIASTITNEDGFFELKNLPSDFTGLFFRVKHKDFKLFEDELKKVLKDKDQKKVPIKLLCNDTCCGRVEITVLKKSDSSAIKEVEIKIRRNSELVKKSYTNSDGKLVFERICPGEYNIRLARNGYKVIEEEFKIEGCDTVRYTFYMEQSEQSEDTCCKGVIIVKLTNSEGESISGVKICLWKEGAKLREEYTNDNGIATFREICKGKYGFSTYKQGYKGQEFQVEIGCNDTIEVNKTLQAEEIDTCCKGVIKVYPRDASNNPINGIYIKLYKDGSLIKHVKSENGYALFTELCKGKYQINIITDLYKPLEFNVELECNDSISIEKTLEKKETDTCCKGKIIIYFKDSTSNDALKNVEIKLYKSGNKVGSKLSDENGRAVFENLCSGEFRVVANLNLYYGREISVNIDCNQTVEMVVKMLKKQSVDTCCTAKLKIKVVDSTETALENATVKLYSGGALLKTSTTNAEGYAVFENLCVPPYKYAVEVSKEGYQSKEYSIEFQECNTITKTIMLKQ